MKPPTLEFRIGNFRAVLQIDENMFNALSFKDQTDMLERQAEKAKQKLLSCLRESARIKL